MRRQCELLGISHSSLYTKPAAPDEEKRLLLEMLMARLDYWHTMLPALGSRKLTVKLQEEGYRVGRKLVRRLMRENPNIENSIFRSIHAVALDTMPGYKSEGVEHSFLERFNAMEAASDENE